MVPSSLYLVSEVDLDCDDVNRLKPADILTHIDKFSGHESWAFLENFSKKKFLLSYDVTMDDNWNASRGINRWRVGAPRHDIKVNLVGYLF